MIDISFSRLPVMRNRFARGAMLIILALAVAFVAYRFVLYNSSEAKQARFVRSIERELPILRVTVDSLNSCVDRVIDSLPYLTLMGTPIQEVRFNSDGFHYFMLSDPDCEKHFSFWKSCPSESSKVYYDCIDNFLDSLYRSGLKCVRRQNRQEYEEGLKSSKKFVNHRFAVKICVLDSVPIRRYDSLDLYRRLSYDCKKMSDYFTMTKRPERIPSFCKK